MAAQHLSLLYASEGTWEYQNQSTGIANFQTSHFLKSELVTWPGVAIIDKFSEIVEPYMRLSTRNENQALASMRDLLLTGLFSKEIRLTEAQHAANVAL